MPFLVMATDARCLCLDLSSWTWPETCSLDTASADSAVQPQEPHTESVISTWRSRLGGGGA